MQSATLSPTNTPRRAGRPSKYSSPSVAAPLSIPIHLRQIIGRTYAKLGYDSISEFLVRSAVEKLQALGVRDENGQEITL